MMDIEDELAAPLRDLPPLPDEDDEDESLFAESPPPLPIRSPLVASVEKRVRFSFPLFFPSSPSSSSPGSASTSGSYTSATSYSSPRSGFAKRSPSFFAKRFGPLAPSPPHRKKRTFEEYYAIWSRSPISSNNPLFRFLPHGTNARNQDWGPRGKNWTMWSIWDSTLADHPMFNLYNGKGNLDFGCGKEELESIIKNSLMERMLDQEFIPFQQNTEFIVLKIIQPDSSKLCPVDYYNGYQYVELETKGIRYAGNGKGEGFTSRFLLAACSGLAEILAAVVNSSDVLVIVGGYEFCYDDRRRPLLAVNFDEDSDTHLIRLVKCDEVRLDDNLFLVEKIQPRLFQNRRFKFVYFVQDFERPFSRTTTKMRGFSLETFCRSVRSTTASPRCRSCFPVPIARGAEPTDTYNQLISPGYALCVCDDLEQGDETSFASWEEWESDSDSNSDSNPASGSSLEIEEEEDNDYDDYDLYQQFKSDHFPDESIKSKYFIRARTAHRRRRPYCISWLFGFCLWFFLVYAALWLFWQFSSDDCPAGVGYGYKDSELAPPDSYWNFGPDHPEKCSGEEAPPWYQRSTLSLFKTLYDLPSWHGGTAIVTPPDENGSDSNEVTAEGEEENGVGSYSWLKESWTKFKDWVGRCGAWISENCGLKCMLAKLGLWVVPISVGDWFAFY